VAAVGFSAREAHAQSWKLGGTAELATGLEGNGRKNGGPQISGARLRFAVDFHVDEFPDEIFAVGGLVNFDHTAFGVDARYIRPLGKKYEVQLGGIAYLAPATLFGPSVDLLYKLPLSSGVDFTVGPEINVFVLGSDLPDGTVIYQALVQLGIHTNL
jgi:hypothetical protein